MCEYQSCLKKIRPLQEEDVLLLLLSRYAKATGSGDLQVYDSDLAEPDHTSTMQEALDFDSGVVNARVSMGAERHSRMAPDDDEFPYEPIPQTPSLDATKSTVTVNFPDLLLGNTGVPHLPPAQSQQAEQVIDVPMVDWSLLPRNLQPPAFRVHKCHHEGVDRSGEGGDFELPDGFPEAVQQICQVPHETYHVGFYTENRSRQTIPVSEGGMQAFECYIPSREIWVYITVQRRGNTLAYNCFRDEEVLAFPSAG
ncbi:hypothetical protein BDW02DRAFT_80934 [Decorospora gaudefroyi]|uniref:Uncharacterized protein n=1 Tax=Decorospora gaudefroyi TaxID=184978 RepID=A0A6A5K0K5_9PLEO|nr:hypothetical protein BDW02DRAFT_80934 [Decorospora gaudefroyi]